MQNVSTQSTLNSNKNPLVSVIVPIYNVETYLDQALESLHNQTLASLEILCVNDGSTDGSLNIVNKYVQSDARFQVITQDNGGYGKAINAGLKCAHGEWIAIFEPDDWIDEDAYSDMLIYAKGFGDTYKDIDIIKCPYHRVIYADTPKQKECYCTYRGMVNPKSQPFTITEAPILVRSHPSIWSALYRKSFLDQHNIKMKEVPGAAWTDNNWVYDTMLRARSIVYLNNAYYHYREENTEKLESFSKHKTLIPFERWQDCQDIINATNCTDIGVLEAQEYRAFSYIHRVEPYVDIQDEPLVSTIRKIFEQINPDILFNDTAISKDDREFFARVRNIECPPFDEKAYNKRMFREWKIYTKNIGLKAGIGGMIKKVLH